jgi:hypothetical protein
MISLIKNEVRIPLSAVFFFGILLSLNFRDTLGLFSAVCFALASLCLFCLVLIMPIQLHHKYTSLENEEYDPFGEWTARDAKALAFAQYRSNENLVFAIAIILLVLGILGVAFPSILRWLSTA